MNMENLKLRYGDGLIAFRLERRDRKSLAISVGPDAEVEVIAPRDAPLVLEKVRKRAPWIQRQQRFFTQFGRRNGNMYPGKPICTWAVNIGSRSFLISSSR